jgi:hypothetical protein
MRTLRITEAFISRQCYSIRYNGCDGYPAVRHFDAVVVETVDGRT